ncbi:hypothetical protein HAX54_032304 [Datura stramonium]|uniref:At1g61320/AtMIF1 LRR domain-containing protein n=1 Tax=Datura stramonium TaxID=4076 RepID=A0ABS8SCP4_DATST|nr:hypothetical protein [Datura stramonium]
MERYRDGKIPIQRFELYNFGYSSEFLPLIDKWLHIALHIGVRDLVLGVDIFTLYPCPIFKILAAESLKELVLSGCGLKLVSLTSGVTNCNSLRKLSLTNVHLDENMLQALLNSCPLIVSFNCKYCSGLEKSELLNLQKIKLVSLRTHRKINQLVKIQAPTLEHMFDSGLLEELDVVECQDLKSLDLST